MDYNAHNRLYLKCKSRKISINHVCEVGVYLPQTSNILDFILEGVKTTLIEPDPKNIEAIRGYFKNQTNISLIPYAIFDYNGTLELVQREASSFVSSLETSPALINDHYVLNEKDKFTVECKKFDETDDGSIDLLSVDTEGCEWYVIKNLVSRPNVISLETHGKSYTNPFIGNINRWMEINQYIVWYKDGTDTVYIKQGLLTLTFWDKASILVRNFKITICKFKYKLKRMIGI